MTNREAIETVQAVKFMLDDYSDRVEMALDMAIEALKDQRPHGERVNVDDRPIGGFHDD